VNAAESVGRLPGVSINRSGGEGEFGPPYVASPQSTTW